MPRKPHISIRSGWRCINDGSHDWRPRNRDGSDIPPGGNGRGVSDAYSSSALKRCARCRCTEAAPAIWLITANHPEHGVIQRHCDSFSEALEVVNRPSPIDSLFDGFTARLGHSLYA
jgi:hypothetical protein